MSAAMKFEAAMPTHPLDQCVMEYLPQLPEPFFSQALALESNVLGVLIQSGGVGVDLVDPSDFSRHENFLVYEAIAELALEGAAPDLSAVAEYLEAHGLLATVGGLKALAGAATKAPGVEVRCLARLLKGYSMMRYEMQCMTGTQYLVPLQDALVRGLAHGNSWVVDSIEVDLKRYIGDIAHLRSTEQIRVCNVWMASQA